MSGLAARPLAVHSRRLQGYAAPVSVLCACIVCALPGAGATAPVTPQAAQSSTPAPAVSTAAPVLKPSVSRATLLIQLHIAALALANMTGDYAVLHELGTPAFQSLNSTQVLSDNFKGFRSSGIDISPAILLPPRLTRAAMVDGSRTLLLEGFYLTTPQRVVFKLTFKSVDGVWRLSTIQVRTVVPKVATS